jgi:hypothetical protein
MVLLKAQGGASWLRLRWVVAARAKTKNVWLGREQQKEEEEQEREKAGSSLRSE